MTEDGRAEKSEVQIAVDQLASPEDLRAARKWFQETNALMKQGPPPQQLNVTMTRATWAQARALPDPKDGTEHTVVLSVDGVVVFRGALKFLEVAVGTNDRRISSNENLGLMAEALNLETPKAEEA